MEREIIVYTVDSRYVSGHTLLSLTPHATVSLSFRLLVGSISPSPVAGPGGALEMGLDHLDITEDTAELPVSDLSP